MTAYGGGSRESRVEIIDNIGKDNEVKAKKEKREVQLEIAGLQVASCAKARGSASRK